MAIGMRGPSILAALGLALPLSGCPRDIQPPPPPAEARPCVTHADCNDGRTCGELALCVGGLCEERRTFAIACREAPPADGD